MTKLLSIDIFFSFWTLSVNKSGQALIESYHELRIGIFYQFGPDNF
ncbi:hypothetical protein O5813_25050 [Escherichia coli]|nr:hypothetical protein [Escherichia coli]